MSNDEGTPASNEAQTPSSPPAIPQEATSIAPPASLREDMLQNAVAFLTHPKVKDSAEDVKRSFLDRKGLTMAEVDEAFRRVLPTQQQAPVPPPSPAQGSSGLVTYQQQQPQPGQPTQQSQQQGPLPAQQSSHGYNLVPSAGQQGGMLVPIAQPQLPPPHEPLRWSQVVLGIGVLAAGVYAVKSLVLPYIHDAYRSWSDRAKAQREAQELQQRALAELVTALNVCKDEVSSNSKKVGELLSLIHAQHAEQGMASQKAESSAAALAKELAGLKAALQQLHPSSASLPSTIGLNGEAVGPGVLHSYPHLSPDPSRSSSSPTRGSVYPGGFDGLLPPPAGYRGGYTERAFPSPGPGSAGSAGQGGSLLHAAQQAGNEGASVAMPGASLAAANGTPYPPSFLEVMDMVSKGITPSNIRRDINDQPPDPSRAPSEPRIPPRAKPWAGASAAKPTGLPFPARTPLPPPSAANGLTLLPPPDSLASNSSPLLAPPEAAASPDRSRSPRLRDADRTAEGAAPDVGTALMHSSREWLGALSPEAPPHGPGTPGGGGSRGSSSGSRLGLGEGSKLNVAAEPYAPTWAVAQPRAGVSYLESGAAEGAEQQQQQQALSGAHGNSGSSSSNPIFQGLEREVRSSGHAEAGNGQAQHQGLRPPAGVPLPAAPATAPAAPNRPVSVLQPNPAWKPPPPPARSIPAPAARSASFGAISEVPIEGEVSSSAVPGTSPLVSLPTVTSEDDVAEEGSAKEAGGAQE